jgi:hypothetical protein
MSPRTERAAVATPQLPDLDNAAKPGKSPLPAAKKPPTTAGMAGVVHQTTPAPEKTRPASPSIRPVPIVPAPALAHGGTDFVDKLQALITTPRWGKLPADVQSKVLAYLTKHHDMLDPFVEIQDGQEDCTTDAAFGKWLQGQREDLKSFYADFYRPVLGAPLVDLHPLTPEQRIDQWLASHRRPGHRPFTAELILGAMRNPPLELGSLSSPALRFHFIDQAVQQMDFVELDQFARGVKGDQAFARADDNWRDIVAAALLQRAVAQQSQSLREDDRAHKSAVCCATNLMVVMDGAGDKLGLLLSQMSKQEAVLFAAALAGEERLLLLRASWLDQSLAALNSAPRTAATSAIVQNLYTQIDLRDLTRAPGLAHDMAVAVAREWHADDTAKARTDEASRLEALMHGRYAELLFGGIAARKAIVFNALRSEPRITAELLDRDKGDPAQNRTVANAMAHVMIATQRAMPFAAYEEDAAWRLGGILAISAGSQLFFSDKVPALARGQALAVIIAHPEINSRSFKAGDNAWLAPALAGPIAALYAEGYGNDTSQSLPGLSLDNMVGFAMGMPPTLPKGQEWQDLWNGVDGQAVAKKVAAGEPVTPKELGAAYDLLTGISFYSHQKDVAAIVEQIKDCADTDPPRVKLLPVTFFGENGPIECPLFRVQSGVNGEGDNVYAYVDNTGRKYDSIEEWEEDNRLPPGKVYYPADGHISRLVNGNGEMKLASADTPRTHQKIREALDTAAMVGCFAAGVVGVVVTGGTLLLVATGVGAASGGWMAYRSGADLVNRYTHGQSISPLDMDALGDYLGGIGGAGVLAGTAARGARLLKIAGVAHKVAAAAGTAGFVHEGGMMIAHWKDIPAEDKPKAVLKWLAFGGLTLAGAGEPRPAAEPPRPPETPIAPASLPTATALPPARTGQPANLSKPALPPQATASSDGRLNGPVSVPARDEVYSNRDLPKNGDKSYDGNDRWPNPWGKNRGSPSAKPTVPPGLLSYPGRGGQPGAAPAAAGAAVSAASSGPAAAKPKPPAVDPTMRRMAGDKGGKTSNEPPKRSRPTNVNVVRRADVPQMPNDPVIANKLRGLASKASRELADVPSVDDLTDYTDARSGERLEGYRDAVANLSRAIHDVEEALKPLDPSVRDSWNSRIKTWRDQLAIGVTKLQDQAKILRALIRKSETVKEDEYTGTITVQAAGTQELRDRLELIEALLNQVKQQEIAAAPEEFN